MDEQRVSRAMAAVAERYAPAIAPQLGGRALGEGARMLAAAGVLITPVEVVGAADMAGAVKAWVDTMIRLHTAMAGALFPSFTAINGFYADQAQPPIVALQADAAPVLAAIGAYCLPYIAARGGQAALESDLLPIAGAMLDELEAGDLPRADQDRVRGEIAAYVRALMQMPVRPYALVPPARALLSAMPPAPTTTPDLPPPPPELPR